MHCIKNYVVHELGKRGVVGENLIFEGLIHRQDSWVVFKVYVPQADPAAFKFLSIDSSGVYKDADPQGDTCIDLSVTRDFDGCVLLGLSCRATGYDAYDFKVFSTRPERLSLF